MLSYDYDFSSSLSSGVVHIHVRYVDGLCAQMSGWEKMLRRFPRRSLWTPIHLLNGKTVPARPAALLCATLQRPVWRPRDGKISRRRQNTRRTCSKSPPFAELVWIPLTHDRRPGVFRPVNDGDSDVLLRRRIASFASALFAQTKNAP